MKANMIFAGKWTIWAVEKEPERDEKFRLFWQESNSDFWDDWKQCSIHWADQASCKADHCEFELYSMAEMIWTEIQNFETIYLLCYVFRLQMRSLEAPYKTNCTQRTLQMLSTGDVYNHTKLACLKKCENQVIVKKCGCRPPMFYGNVFATLYS